MPKIFIIDDDDDLLKAQRLFLEEKGYTVETALDTEEGLRVLKSFKPDVIIADLMMEHYDSGFVFCKKVKDEPDLRSVPIIMQTAAPRELGYKFDVEDPVKREWMKVNEILTKPVPLDHLLGKIEQYLQRKK